MATDEGQRPVGRRGVIAWCLYDWASSAFPTVIVTFVFAAYFTSAVAPTDEIGTGQWGLAMSLSGLAIAILSPLCGAIADQSGRRKPWIGVLTAICVVSGAALWIVEPSPAFILPALVLVVIANTAFEMGAVFYNAMLPEVAGTRLLGRISGWAWGLGYAGGLVCLAVALGLLVQPDPSPLGLDRGAAEHVRATGPLVAVWFLVFALPLFFFTPDQARRKVPMRRAVAGGVAALVKTVKLLPQQRQILRYLIAHLFYIDGLNTLFAFGGIYAAGTFGLGFEEILVFGILLNVTAGLGAFAFAWVDDYVGAKPTIAVSLVALTLLGGALLLIESSFWFYVLGAALGIFIGPTQASSRSLMARLAPPELRTEYFGLYALSGRITAFLGPALVGVVTVATGSQRWGMATVLGLFLLGLAILWPLREPRRET